MKTWNVRAIILGDTEFLVEFDVDAPSLKDAYDEALKELKSICPSSTVEFDVFSVEETVNEE